MYTNECWVGGSLDPTYAIETVMPTEILMPALSPTMEEGKLAKWLVKEGQQVKAGDIIAEIETDKATMEVEAVDEGKVGKLLVPEGTEGVKVNTPIAVLLADGESAGAGPAPKKPQTAVPPPASPAPPSPAPAAAPSGAGRAKSTAGPVASGAAPAATAAKQPSAAPGANGHARILASPLARRLARQVGLDLGALAGSGPHGRIVKSDVEAAAQGGA